MDYYDEDIEVLLKKITSVHSAKIATILGRSGDYRASDALIRALEDVPEQTLPHELIFRYYAVRALGMLGSEHAIPLLERIMSEEVEPVLKGKSIADMARKAIQKIKDKQ